MKRRLFIGISLPPDIVKRLTRKLEPFSSLPVIWTRADNLHITVRFLGWVDDQVLGDIVRRLRYVCATIEAFDVLFETIVAVPAVNPDRIEATGAKNEDLKILANAVASIFDEFSSERKVFHPHITLGRIRRGKWRALAQTPDIDISAKLSVPVTELVLFESVTLEGKRMYVPIETVSLG